MERAQTAQGAPPGGTLPSGTVTFLFTDIEGSTQRWEASRAPMASAVARHDQLLRHAVSAHHGYTFKSLGDAICAAFAKPEDAIACALDAQRALIADGFQEVGGLEVRVALHTGTADERNGDYFGPAVNRVARLLAIGHGGQILVSGTTADLVQGLMPPLASLRDRGSHQLRDLTRPEQVYQLIADGLREDFPPLRSLDLLPNNLPRQATAIIGRDDVIAEIRKLMQQSKLVTLIGTGGVGKTRTALQIGADLLDGSGDGVWFVDLAPITAPEAVASEIAAALSLQLDGGQGALERVIRHLRDKRLLLILDNCEHVVAEASRIVAAILKDCERVTLLATSREGLNVRGEQVYRLPSLTVPAAGEAVTAEAANEFAAVALFASRAYAADPHFTLTDENAPIVAEICRRLDGIALAIELAAARVKILNPRQLAQRLDERFRILTGGDRTALPRQQTMRAAIDWSFTLLSDDEKKLFRRLSVFRGGWTLEAAAAVCGDGADDEYEVFDRLSSLVDKSLVVVEHGDGSQRYYFLESMRQYAHERLGDARETDDVRARHLAHFAAVAVSIRPSEMRGEEADYYERARVELDNFRAAIDYGLEQSRDVRASAVITEALWAYYFGTDQPEGKRRVEAVLALPEIEADPELKLRLLLAYTRVIVFSERDVLPVTEEAAELAQSLGNSELLARALYYVGEAHQVTGDPHKAKTILRRAYEVAVEAGSTRRAATALGSLAMLQYESGDREAARSALDEALALAEASGALYNLVIFSSERAGWKGAAGDVPDALADIDRALRLAKRLNALYLQAMCETRKARLLLQIDRVAEAAAAARSSFAVGRDLPRARLFGLRTQALLASHLNRAELGARIMGWVVRRPKEEQVFPDDEFAALVRERLEGQLGIGRYAELADEGAVANEAILFAELPLG